ncbi:MAG: GNAT family N-acetyltransferase [Blastocatellia bacterium]
MELKLEHSTIRSYRWGDEDSLVRHANNYKVWRNLTNVFPYPYTMESARTWLEYATTQDPEINFAVAVNDQVAGGIGLKLKDDIYRRTAEIGYWLGEEFWGRGIMPEAVRALTDWSFASFDLVRIYAGIFEYNSASMRVLEKAGYQYEARLRKHITKEGQTFDDVIYAIIRE